MDKRKLITQLQSQGLKLLDRDTGRKGGAGPSDHKAVTIDGTTVMIPVHTSTAAKSPYTIETDRGTSLQKDDLAIATVEFPHQPKFYHLNTTDGIPYRQIA